MLSILKKSLILCPLQGGHYEAYVKWGVDAAPRRIEARKEQKQIFMESFRFPVSSGQLQQPKKTSLQEFRPFRDKGLGYHISEGDHPVELQAVNG